MRFKTTMRLRSDAFLARLLCHLEKLLRDRRHLLRTWNRLFGQLSPGEPHPSTVPPDIMRNGLQLLARHSLQHYTARVRVNPKSRAKDYDVKPSESRGSSNTATAWPSARALDEPSRRNLLSDLSVV